MHLIDSIQLAFYTGVIAHFARQQEISIKSKLFLITIYLLLGFC